MGAVVRESAVLVVSVFSALESHFHVYYELVAS